MKRLLTCLLLVLALCMSASKPAAVKPPPNVVLVFVDDMGYGDLSCYGALGYQTPNLDRMAAEGTRFTSFLAAQAVCSASRTALLTGAYPNRVGISGALMPWANEGINASEETLAELLKAKGYVTGIVGKWHLGHHQEFLPLQHGFDEYLGIPYSNDMWPIDYDGKPATSGNKLKYPPLPLIEGNQKIAEITTLADQDQLITRFTDRAVQFIQRHRKQPFFLYLPHCMPHVPIGASERFRGKSGMGLYADTILELDWSVGQILQALKTTGLDRNTLVIFTSDNGPWFNFGNHAGSTGGFREGKGTSFEGGHRVPFIVRWPGVVPAGRVSNKLLSNIDILPTIANLCGAKLPERKIDGVDWTALLKGNDSVTPRRDFFYYYRRNSLEAVRRDHWKLVFEHPSRTYIGQAPGFDGKPGAAPENHLFPKALYDLRRDPAEAYDVQEQYPAIVAELETLAETARQDLGDDLQQRKGTGIRPAGVHK
jgi:arylsulfatase A-like enzyme